MDKKLIAIDLDGTTLNAQSLITPKTQETLIKAQQQGHTVVIATGRPFRMSEQFYRQLKLDSAMVNFNGSLTHKPFKYWEKETEYFIDRAIAFDLKAKKEALGIEFVAAEDRRHFFVSQLDGVDPTFFGSTKVTNDNLLESLKENPTSLLIKTRPETLESVAEELNRSYPDVATKTWGGPHNMLEMTPKGVHKATGLALIADDLGFKPKNIMAFGDEYNDVEMLEFAGRGVVMKNGSEQAKKVANDMTEYTNDEDGLARYLEKYLSL